MIQYQVDPCRNIPPVHGKSLELPETNEFVGHTIWDSTRHVAKQKFIVVFYETFFLVDLVGFELFGYIGEFFMKLIQAFA